MNRRLDHDLLLAVATKYEQIDAVPEGYFYPELFAKKCKGDNDAPKNE